MGKKAARWTAQDRQAFADGQRLRAATIPNKKRETDRKAGRKKVTEDERSPEED